MGTTMCLPALASALPACAARQGAAAACMLRLTPGTARCCGAVLRPAAAPNGAIKAGCCSTVGFILQCGGTLLRFMRWGFRVAHSHPLLPSLPRTRHLSPFWEAALAPTGAAQSHPSLDPTRSCGGIPGPVLARDSHAPRRGATGSGLLRSAAGRHGDDWHDRTPASVRAIRVVDETITKIGASVLRPCGASFDQRVVARPFV